MYKTEMTSISYKGQQLERVEIRMIIEDTIQKPDGRVIPVLTGFADLENSGEATVLMVKTALGRWEVWAS